MDLHELYKQIPDFARDIKLNLEAHLSGEVIAELNTTQTSAATLTFAYAIKDLDLELSIQSSSFSNFRMWHVLKCSYS